MIVVEWFQESGRSHEWFGQTGETIATIESKGTSAVASVIGPRGPAGSGDALVANPLSQFAATTLSQLNGVISDATLQETITVGTTAPSSPVVGELWVDTN